MRADSKRRDPKKRVVKAHQEREGKRLAVDLVRREISSLLGRVSVSKKRALSCLSGTEKTEKNVLQAKRRFEKVFGPSKKKSVGR